MGVRILHDRDQNLVALYDSVTETAFGPLFGSEHDAESFLEWIDEQIGKDVRLMSDAELDGHRLRWLIGTGRI